VELILLASTEYNKSIHSVIGKRPKDVKQTQTEDTPTDIPDRIRSAQVAHRARKTASRHNKAFEGDNVLVKSNRRLGKKLTPLCEERTVETDLGTTVLIKGRVVHKDKLK